MTTNDLRENIDKLPVLNRAAFTISYTQDFLLWLESLKFDEDEPVPEETSAVQSIYLIRELDTITKGEIRDHIRKYWKKIAQQEFANWIILPEIWPVLKTIADFEKYFHWQYVEMLYDLEKTRLKSEI